MKNTYNKIFPSYIIHYSIARTHDKIAHARVTICTLADVADVAGVGTTLAKLHSCRKYI